MSSTIDAPIGVFDSGFGGLTVLRSLVEQLPNEDFIYLGDTARAPYGPRTIAEVRRFALEGLDYLVTQGVKALVIACNSASSAVLRDARERYEVPITEVVLPAATHAMAATRNYLPVNAVVKGKGQYDWSELEAKLDAISQRGKQAVLRFYLDYPTRDTGVPQYLLEEGIDTSRTYKAHRNNGKSFSPDYNDPRVQEMIRGFIAEFGARYDGDERIGFLTTGLVGFWGEQHTYAEDHPEAEKDWMPTKEVEESFFRAWDDAFDQTLLQTRRPSRTPADTAVGFHNDSFGYATLPAGADKSWYFLTELENAGMTERWTTQPIGGEIRPEAQVCAFVQSTACPKVDAGDEYQEFQASVTQTHTSWLVADDTLTLQKDALDLVPGPDYTPEQKAAIQRAQASLGYDFAATQAKVDTVGDQTTITVEVTNRGVAPFYYDWPVQFAIIDDNGNPIGESTATVNVDLPSLGQGDTATWSVTLPTAAGVAAIQIPNPLENGQPIRFANASQSQSDGWLTVGDVGGTPPSVPPRQPSQDSSSDEGGSSDEGSSSSSR